MNLLRSVTWCVQAAALSAIGLLLAACDPVPGPASLDQQLPTVSAFVVTPDTVRAADLPADQVTNGQALIDITIEVTARDPDGTVDRVLAFIDPAYGASTPGLARLLHIEGDRYGGVQRYPIATDQADLFTVRAFAIDDDSLTSNQVAAQIHYLPNDMNAARP